MIKAAHGALPRGSRPDSGTLTASMMRTSMSATYSYCCCCCYNKHGEPDAERGREGYVHLAGQDTALTIGSWVSWTAEEYLTTSDTTPLDKEDSGQSRLSLLLVNLPAAPPSFYRSPFTGDDFRFCLWPKLIVTVRACMHAPGVCYV